MAKLRVRPGNLPHGASVSGGRVSSQYSAQKRSDAGGLPFDCLASAALRLVIDYIEDFDGTIRGACCEALAVVIQLRVVLGKVSVSILTCE
jgi:hypothetical protein